MYSNAMSIAVAFFMIKTNYNNDMKGWMNMPKYYLRETPLANIEVMMMVPPGFKPRGGEMPSRHKYATADCDCKYGLKAEKKKRLCRSADNCVCFKERFIAGRWTLGELVECFAKEIAETKLIKRIRRLLPLQTSSPFKDEAHHKRTISIATVMTRELIPYTAVVFLLSADPTLWRESWQAVRGGLINFNRIDKHDISLDGYTLLQTAKDLSLGGCRLTIDELCDPQLINDELFRLIISAFVIQRYGLTTEMLR